MVGTFFGKFKDGVHPVAAGGSPGNDRCTDNRGYMLVISRNNLARVGHAI
jgi:hypothetical protein